MANQYNIGDGSADAAKRLQAEKRQDRNFKVAVFLSLCSLLVSILGVFGMPF